MLFAILLTFLMLLVLAYDVTTYTIPNWLTGLVLLAYPVYVWLVPVEVDWLAGLTVAGGALLIGLVIFYFNFMGGGDVKLLVACCLWTSESATSNFIFYTAILGGLLAVLLLLGRPVAGYYKARIAPNLPLLRIFTPGEPLPYGVAIAIAMMIVLWMGQVPGITPKF